MNSRICRGRTRHVRVSPVRNTFEYPVCLFAFDLDELPVLDREVSLFGYNRFRPLMIRDRDYLDRRPGSIHEKLLRILRERGVAEDIGRIVLVTDAAYFRPVFNPASFYYCFTPSGDLAAVAIEVNNVVGDRHLYVLPGTAREKQDGPLVRFRMRKVFHVSPFNDREGYYECAFADIRERLEIHVNLFKDGRPVMTAAVSGVMEPFDTAHLRSFLLQNPLLPWMTMPRILWQAAKLYFAKHLKFHERPVVTSPDTIRIPGPSLFQSLCMRKLEKALARIRIGRLMVRTPSGQRDFGPSGAPASEFIDIHDYRFFSSLGIHGDIGFGESYMRGEWDSPSVTGVVRLLIDNRDELTEEQVNPGRLSRLFHRHRHRRRANTMAGSRRNIREHYDFSNEFFARFLDPGMTYSCGYFATPTDSLEKAQENKLDMIIRKAAIRGSDHVLEIGCGWGSFAIRAARQTGCRVTALTISSEQCALARERVKAAGLEDRIEVVLEDYRRATGRFDRIVSIEMLEAVGHENFRGYFAACDSLLVPDGLAVVQVITIPDQRYAAYRSSPDWIQKYIFPGGLLPSLSALSSAMAAGSGLVVENMEDIGLHYAPTLRAWRERFEANPENKTELDRRNPEFRKWIYYFSYCEAAFAARSVEDLQLVLSRPGNRRLTALSGQHKEGGKI